MNRKQTRSLNSQIRRADPGDKLKEAIGALGQIKGAGDVSKLAKDLEGQLEETKRVTDALIADYETLATELEIREEVTLRLLAKFLTEPPYDIMPMSDKLRSMKEMADDERKSVIENRRRKDT